MQTGIGQHCGDCRRSGAAAFAEPSHVVQRAVVAALKQQRASTPICRAQKIRLAAMNGRRRTGSGRSNRMVAIATALGTALVAR